MSRKSLAKRRSELIKALCDLSKDGWARARFDDYAPLEAELRAVETAMNETK